MDNMLQHPGAELQVLIKEKGLTQKAFASFLGKKVSEVNELLKGKRNITIQRDYLLHQHLGTPIKYWILKQIDYDYSLLDINENIENGQNTPSNNEESIDNNTSSGTESTSGEFSSHENNHSEHSEESIGTNMSSGVLACPAELGEDPGGKLDESNVKDSSSSSHSSSEGQTNTQETPTKNLDYRDDEDHQNRVKIFRSF